MGAKTGSVAADALQMPRAWVLVLLGLLALTFTAALAQAARSWLLAARRKRRIHAQLARASEAERRAAEHLEDLGFVVLGTQVPGTYALEVDGNLMRVGVRADIMVQRGRETFVVEVKSGRGAPRLDNPLTRRQLLEYQLAFPVDGVLLFDGETDTLRSVIFPRARRASPRSGLWSWLWPTLLAAASAFAARAVFG